MAGDVGAIVVVVGVVVGIMGEIDGSDICVETGVEAVMVKVCSALSPFRF